MRLNLRIGKKKKDVERISLRRKIYLILESDDENYKKYGKRFDTFMLSLIFLNILAYILESVEEIEKVALPFFDTFETISVYIFTFEYIIRLWCIPENPKYKHFLKGRLKFALTPIAFIDLVAFLPYYLIVYGDFRFLRAFRLFRLFRLFKLLRYSGALKILTKIITSKKADLQIIFFTIFILLLISASVMYQVEHDAQPDLYSSIPQTMWWAVSALTTVGYGDIYPITPLGKFLGSFIALLGVGLFALPAGIIAAGFMQELERETQEKTIQDNANKIKDAFYSSLRKLGDMPTTRRVLDLIMVNSRLSLYDTEIFEAVKHDHELRIRYKKNTKEDRFANTMVIEYFEVNRDYGTCVDVESAVAIVSPLSYAEHSIGHFTWHLAQYLDCDYISNERFGEADHLNPDYRFSFVRNEAFINPNLENIPQAFKDYKRDLADAVQAEEKVFIIKSGDNRQEDFNIHFGFAPNENGFELEGGTFEKIQHLKKFYENLEENFEKHHFYFKYTTHQYYDTTQTDSLHQYIWNNTEADVITLFINNELMEWTDDETYFKIIKILGDTIKQCFL